MLLYTLIQFYILIYPRSRNWDFTLFCLLAGIVTVVCED
jgi:hypothetical protein